MNNSITNNKPPIANYDNRRYDIETVIAVNQKEVF